ncbi:hypothetical protein VOLCADRAFT_117086 [Volvox carteri f. nagariensis]|uniref:Meiosis-specific protein ASY3-like coiled-coil domain-containing protein n=1 Tax=Volvox carteri f. nagariensis TaxID=3068 RepID=D8TS70_VOLCA|nr:uncharacterized protein VOLCADRAFT_117086 [Volvox carteri f. nagariensis]EFJ49773.1 hypothetical protein VOLCADRAFT_117086 [Volvox carteri f. nagariensis]|eukprot:XP_002949280.1 hypothetical protein VOLCADRAFT_117086 [Volvox carteri f. nagariensis]
MPSHDDHQLPLPAMLAASTPSVADDDYGEEGSLDDETELLMLQKVVQQTLEKKKMAAAKQQAQVLEEFKAAAEKRVAALEAAIVKDAKECAALAKATFTKTTQRLEDKLSQMEAVTQKYQQDMAVLWEQYNEEHAGLENATMQIKMTVEQRKQGIKRRITALAQENEAALSEATKKAEAVKGRAAKMPQLAKLLQSLVPCSALNGLLLVSQEQPRAKICERLGPAKPQAVLRLDRLLRPDLT